MQQDTGKHISAAPPNAARACGGELGLAAASTGRWLRFARSLQGHESFRRITHLAPARTLTAGSASGMINVIRSLDGPAEPPCMCLVQV